MKYSKIRSLLAAGIAAAGAAVLPGMTCEADLIPDFATRESVLAREEALTEEADPAEAEEGADSEKAAMDAGFAGALPEGTEKLEGTAEDSEAGGALPAGTEKMEGATEGAEAEGALPAETQKANEPAESAAPQSVPFVPGSLSFLTGLQHLNPGIELPPRRQLPVPQRTMALLRRDLETMLSAYSGVWSVGVKDLSTDERLLINNREMPSASVLKLFILGCVYEQIAEGNLERTEELVVRMKDMISVSSNEAANRLIAVLGDDDYQTGIDVINEYLARHGYSEDTRAYNPFQDPALKLDPEHTNTTSAADTLLLLERIYRRQFGTRRVCNETEEMMLNQQTRYKIPKGVGENALVANKTGETDEIENDAALVFTPRGDYLICIFSTEWNDKKEAQAHFAQLSSMVYSYFTQPETYETTSPEMDELNEWVAEHAGPWNVLAENIR